MEKTLDTLVRTIHCRKTLAKFIKPYLDKSTNMYFRLFFNYLKNEDTYSTLFALLVKRIARECESDELVKLAITTMIKKYM